MESYGCGHHPHCHRRCVGEVVKKYKMYETCCYDVVTECAYCGHEYEYGRHHVCPACGEMDDPPVFRTIWWLQRLRLRQIWRIP